MIKRKSLATIVLSFVALLCFVFGGMMFSNTTTAKADANPAFLSSFKTLAGAEVRTAEPNGIRFTTEISAEEYDVLMAKIGTEYKNVEFGTVICPTYFVENNGGLNIENPEAKIARRTTWDSEFNPTLETEVYQYNGDIIGIQDENLTKEFQALGYVTLFPMEGEAVTYYATVAEVGGNVRSPFQVANTLIANGDDNAFLAEIVGKVASQSGAELILNVNSASVKLGEEKDIAITATVNGVEVSVEYSVADTTIASFADGKLTGLKPGTTKIVATYAGILTAEIAVEVAVDVSAYNGKNSVSMNDLSGNYNFTQTAYYEKGVGVWMYGVVTHKEKSWNLCFCPIVGGVQFDVHSGGENLLPNERKSFENVKIWTVNNPDGSYTSSFIGLAKESYFTSKVSNDLIEVTPIFENGGSMQIHVQAGVAGTTWWQMPSELVDVNGFLDGGDTAKSVKFVDATTKKMFTYSAKLTEYGLFFEAEVRTNASKDANLIFVYSTDYAGAYGEFYLGTNAGEGIWKSVRGLQASDSSAFGFTTQIYYRSLWSWDYLQGKSMVDYNKSNPVESTLYLKVLFESVSDNMSYYRTLNDSANINDNEVETINWSCYQGWVGITSTKRCDHVTKNGIIN